MCAIVFVRTRVCVCAYLCACVRARVCVCAFVRTHVRVCVCGHTCVRAISERGRNVERKVAGDGGREVAGRRWGGHGGEVSERGSEEGREGMGHSEIDR